jgi:hypothetical protein
LEDVEHGGSVGAGGEGCRGGGGWMGGKGVIPVRAGVA